MRVVLTLFWLLAITAQADGIKAGKQDVGVRVLDIGQGHAAVARMPNPDGGYRYIVYDTGLGSRTADEIANVFPECTNIDLLVISHADKDHIGGAEAILRRYAVQKIVRPGRKAAQPRKSKETWKKMNTAIEEENANVVDLSEPGMEAGLPPGPLGDFGEITITALSGYALPPSEWGLTGSEQLNAGSIVVRLEYKGKSVLFTGDSVGCNDDTESCLETIATEKHLIDQALQFPVDSDVLIAPHHGGKDGSSPSFIAAVSPSWVIFPAGSNIGYQHPHKVTAQRYLDAGVDVLRMLRTDRGDDDGDEQWDWGRVPGCRDQPVDDHVDIVITADGQLTVNYASPNRVDSKGCK